MIKLDVPFLPDPQYIALLNSFENTLYSVHFSLFQEQVPDGRHRPYSIKTEALSNSLSALAGPTKYALLNSRFYSPEFYQSGEELRLLLSCLEHLLNEGNLSGITIVDFYLLEAISHASQEIAKELEAVPGINCMLDSFDRIASYLTAIERSNFNLPTKLNLDRSLNRDLGTLREIAARCKKQYPKAQLTLLANEGCLARCPFKFSHDAHIAFANSNPWGNETYRMNKDLGCIRTLKEHPEEILQSPFIRPEDVKEYEGVVDVIKLCGRTLGQKFLMRAVRAYSEKEYSGNLFDLLDTQDWQAEQTHLANEDFPDDFFRQLTECGQECSSCNFCKNLFNRLARIKELNLKDYRSPEPAE